MKISADSDLAFSRSDVFGAYRDRIVDLVPFLPNIRSIEVRSRSAVGDVTDVVSQWKGGGEIPSLARAFLDESMLSWIDRASWDASAWTCAWSIETGSFTEAVRCSGLNRFVETKDGTRLEIRGELLIDASKVKGVPGFLAKKVGSGVEQFLAARIQPNLIETADGIRKFLEAAKG